MVKVFILTSGSYSDYGIEHVFSTREKAENFVKVDKQYNGKLSYGNEYDIEAYDLDPEIKIPFKDRYKYYYYVSMDKDGRIIRGSKSHVDIVHPNTNEYFIFYDYINIEAYINADSSDHAIQILDEKRKQILAEDKWHPKTSWERVSNA